MNVVRVFGKKLLWLFLVLWFVLILCSSDRVFAATPIEVALLDSEFSSQSIERFLRAYEGREGFELKKEGADFLLITPRGQVHVSAGTSFVDHQPVLVEPDVRYVSHGDMMFRNYVYTLIQGMDRYDLSGDVELTLGRVFTDGKGGRHKDILSGMHFYLGDVDVMNVSVSGPFGERKDTSLDDARTMIVTSMGNTGMPTPRYPAQYIGVWPITTAVKGNVGYELASYASYGFQVTAVPEHLALGRGTSFSTSYVAAMLTLKKLQSSSYSKQEIEYFLRMAGRMKDLRSFSKMGSVFDPQEFMNMTEVTVPYLSSYTRVERSGRIRFLEGVRSSLEGMRDVAVEVLYPGKSLASVQVEGQGKMLVLQKGRGELSVDVHSSCQHIGVRDELEQQVEVCDTTTLYVFPSLLRPQIHNIRTTLMNTYGPGVEQWIGPRQVGLYGKALQYERVIVVEPYTEGGASLMNPFTPGLLSFENIFAAPLLRRGWTRATQKGANYTLHFFTPAALSQ